VANVMVCTLVYVEVIDGSEVAGTICIPGLAEGVFSPEKSASLSCPVPAQPATETKQATNWPPYELRLVYPNVWD
jgi:hypothetical protein